MKEDRERRRKYEVELGLRPEQAFTIPNPGVGWTWLIKVVLSALSIIMPVITPVLREELERFLVSYYQKAVETPNPWDDFLARFLLRILSIPIPE